VFRTVLRAVKLLVSLFSTMVLLIAPTPTGGPSLLERIPILMDALEARAAARATGSPTSLPGPAAAMNEPRRIGVFPTSDEAVPVPEGASRSGEPTPPRPVLPTGSDRVRVNRGLP
jgi:hypothetical protein